jgi:phage FluMu protein Com
MCGYSCTGCGKCGKKTVLNSGSFKIPGKCPACGELNSPTSRFCKKCGFVFEVPVNETEK